jgi:PPOX class probable F420-dependent enzyme
MFLDPKTPSHAEADRRLRHEEVVWITTLRAADGQPQSSPVWFLWDGATFLLYSMPSSPKIGNIERHPGVAMNLDTDGKGGGVVTIEGTAEILAPTESPAYLAKYDRAIQGLGYTSDQFATAYSTAIRVTPTRVRVY